MKLESIKSCCGRMGVLIMKRIVECVSLGPSLRQHLMNSVTRSIGDVTADEIAWPEVTVMFRAALTVDDVF